LNVPPDADNIIEEQLDGRLGLLIDLLGQNLSTGFDLVERTLIERVAHIAPDEPLEQISTGRFEKTLLNFHPHYSEGGIDLLLLEDLPKQVRVLDLACLGKGHH